MQQDDPEDARNEELARLNPFMKRAPAGYPINWLQPIDVESRLSKVREFDAEQCRKVIALGPIEVQKTVLNAAQRRLRKLERENKGVTESGNVTHTH